MEAFIMAYTVPSFMINVLAGAVVSSFVPVYIATKTNEGECPASSLIIKLWCEFSLLLIIVTAVLWLADVHIIDLISSGFSEEKKAQTLKLFHIMLPTIFIQGNISFFTGILNASNKFFLAAIAPILSPVVTVIFIVSLANQFGISTLAWGAVVGTILQLAVIAWMVKQRNLLFIAKTINHQSTAPVWKQYLPMVAGATVASGTVIVDQIMTANMLPPSSLAAITYGDRVVAALLGIAGVSLGTAALPALSELTARKEWSVLWSTVRFYRKAIWLASMPICLLFFFFSDECVRFIWERGAFTHNDSMLVADIQTAYAFRIPFFLIGILHARILSSLGLNRILLIR